MNNAHAFYVQYPSSLNITYILTALDRFGLLLLLAVASYTIVAPTTHFEMDACHNVLGASSTYA